MTRSILFLLAFSLDISFSPIDQSFASRSHPKPSGPYSLGTVIFHLTDQTRKDPTDPTSSRGRELMIQIWYPASISQDPVTLYFPYSGLISAMKNEEYLNIGPTVLESWRTLRSHSISNVSIVSDPPRFPLIVFSHGAGVSRSNYTFILEDLASHGFIVVAIDHPASGLVILPDERVLSLVPDPLGPDGKAGSMTQDASFVLDALLDTSQEASQFARHIDTQRIGMFGHSLGGAAALDMGRVDSRFSACANMDGYPFGKILTEGLHQPSLMLLQQPGEPIRISNQMRFERDSLWSAIIQKGGSIMHVMAIKGTSHFNFSDLPFIIPDSLMLRNGGTITPQRGHEIITHILHGFFTHYLKNRMSDLFQDIGTKYPEVTVRQLGR